MFCVPAEDGIRDLVRSRGLGDVYKRQVLKTLIDAMRNKGKEFSHVIKMGRTQLQDAVPMLSLIHI